MQYFYHNKCMTLVYKKTYRKKSEIWPQTTLIRSWGHWADICDIGQILRKLSRIGDIWQTYGTVGWCMGPLADIVNIGQTLGKLGTLARHWPDIGQILGNIEVLQLYNNLSISVRLSVWTIFWPPFNQAISNLSTDLDFLGQGAPN